MENSSKRQLEEANKFIFVERYQQAFDILDQIIYDEEGKKDLLVHLRRIELAVKTNQEERVRKSYLQDLHNADSSSQIAQICLALLDQQTNTDNAKDSIAKFQAIIEINGESAAAYFGLGLCFEEQGNWSRALFNYKESIKHDCSWYPAYFGLSQIYYHQNDQSLGDYYFHIFEQYAPFNLYGNFQTHRDLCEEFMYKGAYNEAKDAIKLLSKWWLKSRGECPIEISIHEEATLAKIESLQGRVKESDSHWSNVNEYSTRALSEYANDPEAMFFIGNILENFGNVRGSSVFYEAILMNEASNTATINRLASYLARNGDFDSAELAFSKAYHKYPYKDSLRFCLLMIKLKKKNINIKEYCNKKEFVQKKIESGESPLEIIEGLHELSQVFDQDPDIHQHLGDAYLRLEDIERATTMYQKMIDIDPVNTRFLLKYGFFALTYGAPEDVERTLQALKDAQINDPKEKTEFTWFKAKCLAQSGDYDDCHLQLDKLLRADPWHISYLVEKILCLAKTRFPNENIFPDLDFDQLIHAQDKHFNWPEFDSILKKLKVRHQYEMTYHMAKVALIFRHESFEEINQFLEFANGFHPEKAYGHLLQLLNTNLDGPMIYFALGKLSKDQWRLEVATMWLEQLQNHVPPDNDHLHRMIRLELADCLVWRNLELEKAVELLNLNRESEPESQNRVFLTLAHAYLKLGQIRSAEQSLKQGKEKANSIEHQYLKGMLLFRNGQHTKAIEQWRMVLKANQSDLRLYNMKQQIAKLCQQVESDSKVAS